MRSCAGDAETAGSSDRTRVCLLTETFYPAVGGGESHARLLASHLNRMGTPAFVLTRRTDPMLSKEESLDGIRIRRVPPSGMKRFGKYFMVLPVFLALVRMRREYDIILVCGFRVLGLPAVIASRLLGKACVLRAEMQGELSGSYAEAYRKLPAVVSALFRAAIGLRNRILTKADAFVSISRPIAEEFISFGANAGSVFEIPNGVDTLMFKPAPARERETLRIRLGLPLGGRIVAYAGKLNRGKGLEHLIRAWESVSGIHKDAHLVLIGSGGGQSLSCEEDLRRLVEEKALGSRVTFTGYVHNVHEYLQASDLLILPSENEAFGLCILEAMSCGIPVIATRVGGIPEIITHLENGVLVEPADPCGLARQIDRLLSQPRLAGLLVENARRTVCEKYSIEAVAARYQELFCSLRDRKTRRLRIARMANLERQR